MNILYIHGFGAKFDLNSPKLKGLSGIGAVYGFDIDYTNSKASIEKALGKFILDNDIELIVGTSLGGYYANLIGNEWKIPFVSINPAIEPNTTLKRYIGDNVDWNGKPYHLSESTVADYSEILKTGNGLVLLDLADDVIDPIKTLNTLLPFFNVETFEGGSHRFEHIIESLPIIKKFYNISEFSSGFGSN